MGTRQTRNRQSRLEMTWNGLRLGTRPDFMHRAERANPQVAEEIEQDASDGLGKRGVGR
jgi:hypothetical protein